LRRIWGIKDERILLGVDRVDYTKGIPERFAAVDRLLTKHPEWKGKICFLQIGDPSRTHIPSYRQLNDDLNAQVEEINWRHGQNSWRPIIFLNEHHNAKQVYVLARVADVGVVSSLHDGMNLVAKEFVAARTDRQGVLVLSQFTGAAYELTDAVPVNPYSVEEFADALHTALTMPPEEQEIRITRMQQIIADNNVYRWAGTMLSEASKLIFSQQPVGAGA
jgi:trehalose 6-phosphate synthase